MGKNVAEVIVAGICLVSNVRYNLNMDSCRGVNKYFKLDLLYSFALVAHAGPSRCEVHIQSFPGLVDEPGTVHFQCRGKKMSFFVLALWVQIVLLGLHLILSFGAVIWCWKFRYISYENNQKQTINWTFDCFMKVLIHMTLCNL